MKDARGFALVSALLLLLVITLLGVSLFLGVGLEQKAAGNSLDKDRALELAQSAVVAAESWLADSTKTPVPQACSGATTSTDAFVLCAFPPATPDDPTTWDGTTPLSLVQNVSQSGGINSYWQAPEVRITLLGNATMGPGRLYQIDAYAYGGDSNTLAAVETVYYVGGSWRNTTPAQSLGQ